MSKTRLPRVLYIHGLNGSPSGKTATGVKSYFGGNNVCADSYNLLNLKSTLQKLRENIRKFKPDIIVGHSLGGFYTLALQMPNLHKILINPAMYPSIAVQKLGGKLGLVTQFIVNLAGLPKYEESIYSDKSLHKNYFSVFSTQDEFPSFFQEFKDMDFENSHAAKISGATHILETPTLYSVLDDASRFFGW